MAAAAHSGSAVSVVVGVTLFVKVGSRGLEMEGNRTKLVKVGQWTEMLTEIMINPPRPFSGLSFLPNSQKNNK